MQKKQMLLQVPWCQNVQPDQPAMANASKRDDKMVKPTQPCKRCATITLCKQVSADSGISQFTTMLTRSISIPLPTKSVATRILLCPSLKFLYRVNLSNPRCQIRRVVEKRAQSANVLELHTQMNCHQSGLKKKINYSQWLHCTCQHIVMLRASNELEAKQRCSSILCFEKIWWYWSALASVYTQF